MSDGTTILDLLSSFCALFTFPMVMKHSTQMYSKLTSAAPGVDRDGWQVERAVGCHHQEEGGEELLHHLGGQPPREVELEEKSWLNFIILHHVEIIIISNIVLELSWVDLVINVVAGAVKLELVVVRGAGEGVDGEVADLGIHGELLEVHHASNLQCLPCRIPDGVVRIDPDGGRSQVQVFSPDLDGLFNEDIWHSKLSQVPSQTALLSL